ncbi:MAG: hypothetical protein E7288_10910 [Lachnospiraceae bacterium]|nr:hypothetical protein [Lachnospiraceae bacterium]
MKKYKTWKIYFIVSCVMLLLFSCSFMLMPLPEQIPEYDQALSIGVGSVFWIGFFGGYFGLAASFLKWTKYRKERGKQEKYTVIRQIVSLLITLMLIAAGVWGLWMLYRNGYGSAYINYVILSVVIWIWNCYFLFGSGLYRGLRSATKTEGGK